MTEENIVSKVFSEALTNETFRRALLQNPSAAIQEKGWKVSKQDMNIIERILSMDVKQLMDLLGPGGPPPPPPWLGDDLLAYLRTKIR